MAEFQRVASSIARTCDRLSIGQTTFHELVKQGRIKVFKLGRKTLVPESEILRLVAEQLEEHAKTGRR